MKKFNNSPELIILTVGLFFAVLILLGGLFYQPPVATAKVIYQNNAQTVETAPTEHTTNQIATEKQTETQVTISGKININTADKDTLCTLKGIGEVKAEKIIDYRNSNGNFKSIDEIMLVNGIGEKTFENIKNDIVV